MRTLLSSLVLLVAGGCTSEEAPVSASGSQSVSQSETLSPLELSSLSGIIISKKGVKGTPEAWMAGASDFFVLDVAGAPVKDRTAKEGVILLASRQVSAEVLTKHVGQRVEVRGVYVTAKRRKVEDGEALPRGPDGLSPATGGGFKVLILRPASGGEAKIPVVDPRGKPALPGTKGVVPTPPAIP